MKRPRNSAGPEIRRLRMQREMTQPMLAAKCNLLGWNLSRETLAKIETQVRWISDCELLCFARALDVRVEVLLREKTLPAKTVAAFLRSHESPPGDG